MTLDLLVAVASAGTAILSAGITGGVVWGLLRGDVTRMAEDMAAVKQALGLELSDGEIKTAFVPRAECAGRMDGLQGRADVCEEQLDDHEQRLITVETRTGP